MIVPVELMVTSPLTFKVLALLAPTTSIFKVPLTVKLAMDPLVGKVPAGVSNVTATPELIMTISPLTGTAAPPQVAVTVQLPVTEAVLVAALAVEAPSSVRRVMRSVRSERAVSLFIKVFWSSAGG